MRVRYFAVDDEVDDIVREVEQIIASGYPYKIEVSGTLSNIAAESFGPSAWTLGPDRWVGSFNHDAAWVWWSNHVHFRNEEDMTYMLMKL